MFDFIKPDVAKNILDKMIENVSSRVRSESGIILEFSEKAHKKIQNLCTEDLSNGGRGIGNRLEVVLINPLARSLFKIALDQTDKSDPTKIQIDDIQQSSTGIFFLIIQGRSALSG